MEQGRFRKSLNLLDMTLLGLGAIIGSGWLYGALFGAMDAGGEAWLAWVIGAIAVMLIGLVYAELGSAWPRSGGIIRYPQYSHGSLVGFFMGFASLLAYSSVAGIEAQAARQYASHYIPALTVANSSNYTALGLLAEIIFLLIFFLLNYWGVHIFGKTNTVWTAIKFIVPTLTMILLFTHFHGSNFAVHGAKPGGIHGVFTAVSGAGIAFAFLGFRQAVDFAGEAKNPQKNVPMAIILSIAIGAVLYILLQVGFLGAVPSKYLAGGWSSLPADWANGPYAQLAGLIGLQWLALLLFADAVISPAGTGNIYLGSTTRVLFAWTKNGYFYSLFKRLNPRTGIPRPALWLSFILSIVWILPNNFHSWQGLVGAITSATVLTYIFGPVTALSLRRTAKDARRPFRLGGMGIIAPLAFIAGSWIVYWSGWGVDKIIISMTLGSLVLYFAFMDRDDKSRAHLRRDWKSGIWVIVYYIFLGVMSRIGSYGPMKNPIVTGPWLDTGIVAIGAIIFFYWGVASALKEPDFSTDDETDTEGLEPAVNRA